MLVLVVALVVLVEFQVFGAGFRSETGDILFDIPVNAIAFNFFIVLLHVIPASNSMLKRLFSSCVSQVNCWRINGLIQFTQRSDKVATR